ncbi:CPBP family intramembrane metalloprotease [Clostridium sp. YIM B02505]|uniref:CPBP family intramembrane metalloprotease n=1 Tax=Clostridium yunnanense TaxID=2800325 RepID=A0ABS1EUQ3_9CLOT|nr:CPBP family intramembrane glutamic endopeptidase [Clostridium yunnanense]MBK1813114.1 CPBP family intramembrane metalloprotease [Clostridium yunnanense]
MEKINFKLKKNTLFTKAHSKKIKYNIITIIITYFCLWLVGLFLGRLIYNGLLALVTDKASDVQSYIQVIRKIVVCGVQITLFFIWVKFVEKRPIKTMGFSAERPALSYICGVVAGFLSILIITALLIIFKVVQVKGINTSFSPLLFILIVISWMVQSSAEEIAIRGWLIPSLGNKSTPFTSIVITSIIFGILHLFTSGVTILSFINLILSGAFFALIAIYYNNIWGVLGLHFMWNLTLGNIFGFPVSGFYGYGESILLTEATSASFLTGGTFGPEGGFIATVIVLIGIFVMGFKLYCKYK